VFERLRGGLIVSCQAPPEDPLSGPEVMALMAEAAGLAGAVGIRANGPEDVGAIRRAVELPLIGLWKAGSDGVYITPTPEHAAAIARAGADVIALDGTSRKRPDGRTLEEAIAAVHKDLQRPVLADVSTLEEGIAAVRAGADAVATTLSGYTPYTRPPRGGGPDLALVGILARKLDVPVIAEGRIRTPEETLEALERGAWAVAVGTAITRPQLIARRFVESVRNARESR